jgi:YD repeat-containing protein
MLQQVEPSRLLVTVGARLMRALRYSMIVLCLLFGAAPLLWAQSAGDGKDDPFYGQKGQHGATDVSQLLADSTQAVFQQVQEDVQPFTGNLSLVHTDLVLPGNGGFDLKVQRTYNSRIWGRRDVTNPGVVAYNERSVAGLGWSFHFGRVRNPTGSGSQNPLFPNNPIVEMPDGSQHPLYRDPADGTGLSKISLEQWKYRPSGNSYLLTLTDGTVYEFPSSNVYGLGGGGQVWQVSRITDPNGNVMTFTYDPTDLRKVTSVTDTLGRLITFTYTTISNPAQCTINYTALSSMTVNGKIYTYDYLPLSSTTLCHLFASSVTPPTGPAWTYAYGTTNPGLYELISATSPQGAAYSYGYGDVAFNVGEPALPAGIQFSVVTSRTLSGGGLPSTTWTYNYGTVAVGANQITNVSQSGCSRVERFTFASFGTIGNGNIWRVGSLLKKETLNGASLVEQEDYVWNPSAAISNDGRSNGLWGPTPITDTQIFMPLLGSRTITRDSRTYTTSYSAYDSFANPGTISETGNASRTTALTYYTDTVKNIVRGRPLSQQVTVGAQSFTTAFTYDANGNLKTTNQYGVLTTFNYFANGNLLSRVNALNRTTSFTYQNGRVSGITNPVYGISRVINIDGNITSETNGRNFATAFSYDNVNRVIQVTPPLGSATVVSYNDGARTRTVTRGPASTTFTFDGLGRVVSTSATGGILTQTTYNACGQRSYQSFPYTTTNIGDAYAYDVLDRVTTITHPGASTINYNYASGNVAITNERNITVTYNNSAFGDPNEKRLLSAVDATGTTSYTYNTLGSLTGITHPGGLVRSFAYDTKNFLTGETHPETSAITYGRDAIGNLTSKIDGKGTTGYGYDLLNRLTSIDYPGTADDTTFTYDNADNRLTASSPAASRTFLYDQADRMTSQQITIGALTKTTGYGYDGSDNLTTLTYPTGRVLTYGYDAANRVLSLASGATNYVTSVTYHPSRVMTSMAFANGTSTSLTYDTRYRVSRILATGLVDFTYAYDGANNVVSITDALTPSKNRAMTYDNVDRLVTASGLWGAMSFTYSPVGNRLTKTVGATTSTYAYGANNRLTGVTGGEVDATIAYDTNGNMTGLRGFTLAYDPANRLTSVNTTAVTYTYEGDGQRIKKVNSTTGKTTLYYYDRGGQLLAETDAAGAPISEYLYLNGQLVARIDPNITPPTAPASLTASAASTTQINLSWTASTDNIGVTGYRIERCQGVGCTTFLEVGTTAAGVLTFSNTGLITGNPYTYRVRAYDALSNLGAFSPTATAVTTDTTAPNIGGGVGIMVVSTSRIDLTWEQPTEGSYLWSYRVERCQGAGCTNFVEIAAPTLTSYSDTGLTAATTYRYRERCVDYAGNAGGYSSIYTKTTTLPADVTPPTAPGSLTATPVPNARIDLSWTAATDAGGITDYRIERCRGVGCSDFVQIARTTPPTLTYSNMNNHLLDGNSYTYRVRATDATGNFGVYSASATAVATDSVNPTTPSALLVMVLSQTQVVLTWTRSTDYSDSIQYQVERCQGASCTTFVPVVTVPVTTVTGTGLAGGTVYRYRVQAIDSTNHLSTYSGIVNATTF